MRVIKQSDYFNYYDQFHTPMQHIIIYLYLLYIYIPVLFCSQMVDEDERYTA